MSEISKTDGQDRERVGKLSAPDSFSLIDATCSLALLTAALYFLSSIYFRRVHRILGSFVSWRVPAGSGILDRKLVWCVLCLFLVIGVIAFFWGLIENELNKIIRPSQTKSEPAAGFGSKSRSPRFGTLVLFSIPCSFSVHCSCASKREWKQTVS